MAAAKKGTKSSSSSSSSSKQSGSSTGGKSVGGANSKGGKSDSSSSSSKAGKSGGSGRGSGKRELIDTGSDKRFVRRDGHGQFKESDDVGRSLATDRRKKAKIVAKSGQGDRGDRAKS